jgi:hypothetical protein
MAAAVARARGACLPCTLPPAGCAILAALYAAEFFAGAGAGGPLFLRVLCTNLSHVTYVNYVQCGACRECCLHTARWRTYGASHSEGGVAGEGAAYLFLHEHQVRAPSLVPVQYILRMQGVVYGARSVTQWTGSQYLIIIHTQWKCVYIHALPVSCALCTCDVPHADRCCSCPPRCAATLAASSRSAKPTFRCDTHCTMHTACRWCIFTKAGVGSGLIIQHQ